MTKAIGYYRVSTGRQGRSGLGLEAQMKAVQDFAKANEFDLINDFMDVNSGRRNDRPGLRAALKECKRQKAILIIASLDRLSRSVAFISTLMESNADFKVVDNPYADKFTIHILAAVGQRTREDISRKTTLALAAAKMRGVQLGLYGKHYLSKLNRIRANDFAERMAPFIQALQVQGYNSLRSIARQLNKLKVPTFYGLKWHATTVQNILKRLRK